MKNRFASLLIAACVAMTGAIASFDAKARIDGSTLSAVSALPLASVLVLEAATGSAIAVPLVFSAAGAVLVVKAVEVSAQGTVYVLERASDGARASIEVVGRGVAGASIVAGTLVTVSVIGAGVVLSAAGEAIAFIPNELGRALLHNERRTY
ncbi:MAG: hypothetical protein V4772_02470 [Pseudomonadota bacterium]